MMAQDTNVGFKAEIVEGAADHSSVNYPDVMLYRRYFERNWQTEDNGEA